MKDVDDFADVIIKHSGWVGTTVAAAGLWILKKLFATQLDLVIKMFEEVKIDIRDLKDDVGVLKEDVSLIKGVLRERERSGHLTWPGDAR
jgi:hypothetical protein